MRPYRSQKQNKHTDRYKYTNVRSQHDYSSDRVSNNYGQVEKELSTTHRKEEMIQ